MKRAMIPWIVLILLASNTRPQTAPGTLVFKQRHLGEAPPFQNLSVPGSGIPTVGTCSGSAFLCSAVTINPFPNGLHLSFGNGSTYDFPVGSLSATISVVLAGGPCAGGCPVTINFNVIAETAPVIATFSLPQSTHCFTTGPPWQDLETCPPSRYNERPGGSFNMPASAGQSYTDDSFGATRTRVTAADSTGGGGVTLCKDSEASDVNADGTLVFGCVQGGAQAGAQNIYLTDGSGIACSGAPYTEAMWDPNNKWTYFALSGKTIKKVSFTLPGCKITTNTTVYSYRGKATSISNSSDADINRDGWLPWMVDPHTAGNDPVFGAYNVYTGASATFNYGSIATLGASIRPGQADNLRGIVTISRGRSGLSGKYLIMLDSAGYNHGPNEVFALDPATNTISDYGSLPLSTLAGWAGLFKVSVTDPARDCGVSYKSLFLCASSVHGNWVEAQIGGVAHELFIRVGSSGNGRFFYPAPQDYEVSGIAKSNQSVEEGGGQYYAYALNTGSDYHVSCSSLQPVCALETDTDPQVAAFRVSRITTGRPPTVTSSTAISGISNGDTVVINNAQGLRGINKQDCAVGLLTGNSFQCTNLTVSGSYAGHGSFLRQATRPAGVNQSEVMLLDFTNLSSKSTRVIRLYKGRGISIAGDEYGAGGYYTNQVSISANGAVVCSNSNGGIPDDYAIYCSPTGWTPHR